MDVIRILTVVLSRPAVSCTSRPGSVEASPSAPASHGYGRESQSSDVLLPEKEGLD